MARLKGVQMSEEACNRIQVFDGHNDTLTHLYHREDRSFFERSEQGHLDLPRAREGGLAGGIFAIFTPPESAEERDPAYGFTLTEGGYDVRLPRPLDYGYAREYTHSIIRYLNELVNTGNGQVGLVQAYQDLERNYRNDVFSMVLALEGAEAIQEDLSDLEAYYAIGMRVLAPVWSRPNAFGCGVPFRFPHSPDTGPGLTEAGKRLVQGCNRLGILLDLAHINERGFWDVAELSNAPLVVSHTGVHSICPSTRNLTDAQLDAIGQTNGLLGVIFEPVNTRPDGWLISETPLSIIVQHIVYVVERIGVEHVAFGADFDGADMPDELGDVTGLPTLIQALRERGYDQESLDKIAYRNQFRVFKDSWKPLD
jgi:membrane dipeptidase